MTELQPKNQCEFCGFPKDIGEHSSDCPNKNKIEVTERYEVVGDAEQHTLIGSKEFYESLDQEGAVESLGSLRQDFDTQNQEQIKFFIENILQNEKQSEKFEIENPESIVKAMKERIKKNSNSSSRGEIIEPISLDDLVEAYHASKVHLENITKLIFKAKEEINVLHNEHSEININLYKANDKAKEEKNRTWIRKKFREKEREEAIQEEVTLDEKEKVLKKAIDDKQAEINFLEQNKEENKKTSNNFARGSAMELFTRIKDQNSELIETIKNSDHIVALVLKEILRQEIGDDWQKLIEWDESNLTKEDTQIIEQYEIDEVINPAPYNEESEAHQKRKEEFDKLLYEHDLSRVNHINRDMVSEIKKEIDLFMQFEIIHNNSNIVTSLKEAGLNKGEIPEGDSSLYDMDLDYDYRRAKGDAELLMRRKLETWQITKKIMEESGLVSPEAVKQAEEAMIEVCSGKIDNFEGGGSIRAIELGLTELVPKIIGNILNRGGHADDVKSEIAAANKLIKKIPPEEIDGFITSTPTEQQEIIRQIADPDSYLNTINMGMGDGTQAMQYELFRHGGDILKFHTELSKEIEEKTGDVEKGHDTFTSIPQKVGMNKLEAIREAASIAGRDVSDTVKQYRDLFGEHDFYFSRGEKGQSLGAFIQELASDLDEDPSTIFVEHAQTIHSSFPYDPRDAIPELIKIAELIGKDKKEFIMSYSDNLFNNLSSDSKDSLDKMFTIADAAGIDRIEMIEARFDTFYYSPESELFQAVLEYISDDPGVLSKKIGEVKFEFTESESKTMDQLYNTETMKSSATMRENTLAVMGQLERMDGGKEFMKLMLTKFSEGAISESEIETSLEYFRLVNSYKHIFEHKKNLIDSLTDALNDGDKLESITNVFKENIAELITKDPESFIKEAQKKVWIDLFGEDSISQLLDSLPKETDERRNALTHNPYDRTSALITSLQNEKEKSDFELNSEELSILSNYVQRFKLSNTPMLYRYFKALHKHEEFNTELPEDIIEEGITSLEELENRMQRIKELIYSEESITEMPELSKLELDLLSNVTGKSSHKFNQGRPSIERIVDEFNTAQQEGKIEKMPEAYQPFSMQLDKAEIKFDAEKAEDDFIVLQKEILNTIDNLGNIDGLKDRSATAVQTEIDQLQSILEKKSDNQFIKQKLEIFQKILDAINNSDDVDKLLGALLDMEMKTLQKSGLETVLREIILQRAFSDNYSNVQVDEISASLQRGINPDSILRILNLHDDFIKEHVLNVNGRNDEQFWSEETWDKIIRGRKSSKRLNIGKVFQPRMKSLREAADNFETVALGNSSEVRAIPDRGLVGEMSGYLADVCYTAEYPLLEKYKNVTPFKFVVPNNESGESKFIGSVLIFEVNTDDNEKALLVRGFDVPKEDQYDIAKFIESFIDQMQKVAEERGATKIIIPGDQGAMSNYRMTINHFQKSYTKPENKVDLSEQFNFNNHDLTNNSYVARKISLSSEVAK